MLCKTRNRGMFEHCTQAEGAPPAIAHVRGQFRGQPAGIQSGLAAALQLQAGLVVKLSVEGLEVTDKFQIKEVKKSRQKKTSTAVINTPNGNLPELEVPKGSFIL